MSMRKSIVIVLLLGATCAPAYSAEPSVPGPFLQERDVGLFFDYLREAIDAASEGRAAPPPEALARRAEEISEQLKQHGLAAARGLVDALESTVRDGLDKPRPPAVAPGQIRL